MSFRKLYIAILFIFCFSCVSLKAIHITTFARWPIFNYIKQKFINSYCEFKKKDSNTFATHSYNNYFSLFTFAPKLYTAMFRTSSIARPYLIGKPYQPYPIWPAVNDVKQNISAQNSIEMPQLSKQLEQEPSVQTPISLLDKQDKESVLFINQIMDINDSEKFKTIGEKFLQLKELNQNYPELSQLMDKHVKSPDITTFVQDLTQLATQQQKLPEKFDAAFQEHRKKIELMGNWEYYSSFVPAMYKKF